MSPMVKGWIAWSKCVIAPMLGGVWLVGGISLWAAPEPAAKPEFPLPTPDKLATALRYGLFHQVLAGTQLLLSSNDAAPVYGVKAVAHAALEESEQANTAVRRATRNGETNANLYALNVQAMQARTRGAREETAKACAEAIQLDPKHPLAYVTLALLRIDESNYVAAAEQANLAIGIEGRMSLAHTTLGQALRAQGKLEEAKQYFQNAQILDASDLRPRVGLGEIAALQGNLPEALRQYKTVLSYRPDIQSVRETVAGLELLTGNVKEAIADAKMVLEKDPKSVPASLALGRGYALNNQFAEAVEVLNALLQRKPDHGDAAYVRNMCLLAMGKLKEARESFDAAIQANSRQPGTYLAGSVLQQLAGDFAAATNLAFKAVSVGGTNWQPRVHFQLANLYLAARKWQEATNQFAQATGFFSAAQLDRLDFPKLFSDAPALSSALVNLGALFMEEGLVAPAIQAFKEARDRHPANVIALFIGSNAQARKLLFDQALNSLRELTELAPRYAPAHFAMGEVYLSQRNATNALPAYLRAVELDPNNVQAHFRLASLNWEKQAFQDAEQNYRQILKLVTNSAFACNQLANLLIETKGDLNEALDFANKAVEYGRRDGAFLDTLGWVQYHRGEFQKAKEAYQAALDGKLAPQFAPLVRFHLAQAFQKLGNKEQALNEVRQALSLKPELTEPELTSAKSLLAELEKP